MKKQISQSAIAREAIERHIHFIRNNRVMLDSDLAERYGVSTKVLVQAVKRNLKRFPHDFMYQLTPREAQSLRSQIVTSKEGRGGRRYLPYVFTEQGVAMLSSVLNSARAIQVNIGIIRAFVRLREMVANQKALTTKLGELERKIARHDKDIQAIFDSIYELTDPSRLSGTISASD